MTSVPLSIPVSLDPSGGLIIVDKSMNTIGKDKGNVEIHYLFCGIKNRFGRNYLGFRKDEWWGQAWKHFSFHVERTQSHGCILEPDLLWIVSFFF